MSRPSSASARRGAGVTGDALPADRLLEMDTLPVSPAPGLPSLFTTGVARLRSGDRVAIMGRNGCGKSSLLRLLWQQMNDASPLPAAPASPAAPRLL